VTEPSQLSPAERVKRYRELEQQALREARNSTGSTAEAYEDLAKAWARLAETTEESIAKRATELPEDSVEQREAALRPPPDPDPDPDPKS
jgi:hypothetical protein